jgi:NAD(P)-dependent dehydrogenase (short-subunit alcohol dehydrogenase family)
MVGISVRLLVYLRFPCSCYVDLVPPARMAVVFYGTRIELSKTVCYVRCNRKWDTNSRKMGWFVPIGLRKCYRDISPLSHLSNYAFNNAGIGPDGDRMPLVPVAECSEEIWARTLNVILKGVFLYMKYDIRKMLKQKYGAIRNNSSVGDFKAIPGFAAYDASKLGPIGPAKAAALECVTSG